MPDYLENIYSDLSNEDPTFSEDVSLEDFRSAITSDGSYRESIYQDLSDIDNTFSDDVAYEDFENALLGEKPKDKDEDIPLPTSQYDIERSPDVTNAVEQFETRLIDIDTHLAQLQVEGYQELDAEGKPLPQSVIDAKIAALQKEQTTLTQEKLDLEKLIEENPDYIDVANKLLILEEATTSTQDEVNAAIAEGAEFYDSIGYGAPTTTYTGGNAQHPWLQAIISGDEEKIKDVKKELDTDEAITLGEEDLQEEGLGEGMPINPITQQPEFDWSTPAPTGASTTQLSKTDFESKKEMVYNRDFRKQNSWKEYQSVVQELKAGAESAGYAITTNKAEAEKSKGTNNPKFYIPTFQEFQKNPNVLFEIEKNPEVFNAAAQIATRDAIDKNKLESKEVRDQYHELLSKFEDDEGTSFIGSLLSKTGSGPAANLMLQQVGIESDLDYKVSQAKLAKLIELGDKGADLEVKNIVYDLNDESYRLKGMEEQILNMKKMLEGKDSVSESEIKTFNVLREEFLSANRQLQADMEYLGELTFEGSNVGEIVNKTKKTYDGLSIVTNRVESSAVGIVAGLGAMVNELNTANVLEWAGYDVGEVEDRTRLATKLGGIFGEGNVEFIEKSLERTHRMDESADEFVEKLYETQEGIMEKNREGVRFGEIDSVVDGLWWGTEMMASQFIQTGMSIALPGSAGLIIAAVSSAGNQAYDMKKRIEGTEWSDKEKAYIQDFKNEFGFNPMGFDADETYRIGPEDINALQFYGTAAIYGLSEYVSEKITLGNFKMGANNLRKAFDLSDMGKAVTNKPNVRWLNLKNATKDFVKGVPGEAFGEGMVQLTQNAAEIYILGNNKVSLLDGVGEAAMSGLVMSGTMQGPGLLAQTYKAFRGPDDNAKISQRGDEIQRLSNSIKSYELQLAGLKPWLKGHDVKRADVVEAMHMAENQLDGLLQQQIESQQKTRADILSYTPTDRQSLIDMYNHEHKVRHEIDEINDNSALSEKDAKAQIKEKLKELTVTSAIKNMTLSNAEWNADKGRSKKFSDAWRSKNGTQDQVEMVVGDNNQMALDAGLEYIDTRDDLSKEEKNQVKDQMRMEFDRAKEESSGDYTVNGLAFGDNLTVETTNADQSKTTRKVNVPMTFALNRSNRTVQSHEIGHHTLFKQFMKNNPDAVGLVQDLESYIKKNYGKAYETFLDVNKAYAKFDEKGELKNAAEIAEEKLAALSDFMRQNNLEGMKSLRNKLFGRFKKFNDGSGQIATGKDVLDMLISYNQSFKTGELTGLTKSIAEGTADISRKKKKVKTVKAKDTQMEGSLQLAFSKRSMTKAEKAEIELKLNEAPGAKGPDGKYKMTKKQWQADKDRGFSKVYTALVKGDLDGLILAAMPTGKDIHGQPRDQFIKDLKDKLADHLLNFNPQANDSLFGWMNSYIGLKSGTVADKAKKRKLPGKTVSTDQTVGDTGRTYAEIIPAEQDIDALVDESIVEDTIDNMRTKLGIEKDGPIYNKVLDSVKKVFGTKLPEVTNKRFKEDLKKAFNTELFKEIKNYMGTRAKFKSFLNENFESVFGAISQEVMNKRFEQFIEPLIDPRTGKQARPDNNPLFRKRDVSKKEFIEYFLGKDVGASTKGTRKDALAAAIAQELGFDAAMEVLADPATQQQIKDIYELQGLRQAENYTAEVGKKIDRIPGSKFNKTKKTSLEQHEVSKELQKFKDYLSDPINVQAIKEGQDLKTLIEKYVDKLDPLVVTALNKEITQLQKIGKKFRKQQLAVLENLDDIINTHIDLSDKDKKALIKKAKDLIKRAELDSNIDDVITRLAQELALKDGIAYEHAIYDKIKEAIIEYNIEGLEVSDKGPTEEDNAADLVAKIFEQQFNVEVKLEKPRYSSVTIIYDLLNFQGSIKKDYPFNKELLKLVNQVEDAFINYKERGDQIGKELFGDKYIPPKKMGDPIPKEVFEQLKLEGLQKELTKALEVSTDLVSKLYWAKGNGTAYIQIKGKGLFYLPNPDNKDLENPLKLKIPAFDGTVDAVLAVSKTSVDSKNPTLYKDAGVKLVDGKLPGSKGFASVGMRIQMMNLKGLKDSDIHLDNIHSIKKLMNSAAVEVLKVQESATDANIKQQKDSGVIDTTRQSKTRNNKETIDQANIMDKALNIARDPNAPIKKIRVFDFDDTLARTKSDVLYTMPDGTTGKLTAEQFAEQGDSILEQGGEFDFSEFNEVKEGKPGPLLDVAKKIQKARGTEDVFILTARNQAAGPAIKQFLDALGLNIPLKNITGLGNSSPLAKSNWIVDKAAEGYNDFYFADDATQNVDAVKKVLDVIDVKSKVQQAKAKFSKTVDKTINDIIEHKTGIKSEKEYSDVKARLEGRKKGRFKFFVPPSAEDFVGLLYSMLGKGEIGDMQMEWFKENLLEPYGRAMENISRDQNRMINDFKTLKNQLVKEGLIPKNLNKKAYEKFTYQDVARILAWNKQGLDIPGLSKTDLKGILKFAKENPAIDVFAQNLIDINKGDGYAAPTKEWLAGTISTDLLDGLRNEKRSKYLQEWQAKVDIIFSNKNLNKMEAALGSKWREAMENMLDRMKSGKNRTSNAGRLENRLLDYINNSVGTVMFFNMRSAVLQTISAINFINWGSNNILAAGKAFANQKQYWGDFMELMNSDFLVHRRNGLRLNVSESEIADAAATSKNKAKAAIAWLLQKGYLPTQIADSFAIASGGATFYRNRMNELIKEGMSEADAKAQAFLEFREIAEESQQSSRPDRISQQQASSLGRVILAFANTPMQYNRIIKKAASDLMNRRGDTKSNISKIAYYAAIQNVIFNALQQALFALAFDDEEDEKDKQKYYNVANGMMDSILRGAGIAGTAVSTLIAITRKVIKEAEKAGTFPGPDFDAAAFELLNFSPPIDIKVSKLRYAGNNWKYEGWKHDDAKWGIDDPAWTSAAYVISSLTNVPLDRLLKKMDNVKGALDANEEAWKRVAMALGWSKWQLKTSEEIKAHRAEEKPQKKEAMKRIYGEEKPSVYDKKEQEEILKKHGYSDDEIKAMKKEDDRVEAILQKQKETGKVYKPTTVRSYKPKKILPVSQTTPTKQVTTTSSPSTKPKPKPKKQLPKTSTTATTTRNKIVAADRTKRQVRLYKLKKQDQLDTLQSLGVTPKVIKTLTYEEDRVRLIEKLYDENK